ncbi:hypothetical protein EV361DRAFT_1038162, partial [Lentinula raphanica]
MRFQLRLSEDASEAPREPPLLRPLDIRCRGNAKSLREAGSRGGVRDIAKELNIREYIFEKQFDFSAALLRAVTLEGTLDHLDDLDDLDDPDEAAGKDYPEPSARSSPLLDSPPNPKPPRISLPVLALESSPLDSASFTEASNARKRKLERSKAASKRNRQNKRKAAGPKTEEEIQAKADPASRYAPDGRAFQTEFSTETEAPVASTSYVGLHDDSDVGEARTWSVNELVGPQSKYNFSLVPA